MLDETLHLLICMRTKDVENFQSDRQVKKKLRRVLRVPRGVTLSVAGQHREQQQQLRGRRRRQRVHAERHGEVSTRDEMNAPLNSDDYNRSS